MLRIAPSYVAFVVRDSRHFARVCNAVICLHTRLLKKPEPVPDNSTDQRWKWFKNCLGALDGTYIKCLVPVEEKARYRTGKNDIATNVLGVCSQDMQFIYVLTGWEVSAADDRVLRDALLRPHGLKVPRPSMASQNRNYRPWTSNEEAKLVEALVNLTTAGGFKADNGFKSGYLQHLEQALELSVPNSGILGNPHIASKIKTIKRDWQCVYDMVNGSNTSGFGYDPEKQFVTAEEPVWEAYLQVHKETSRWRNKTFPYYEDLCIVFGKDRAQGNRAKDFVEMEQEHNEASPSVVSRKRNSQSDEGFNNAVSLITESLKEISKDLSQGIKFDMKINELSDNVPPEILKMNSLTQIEKFKALNKIRSDPINVQNFWQLAEGDRDAWVKYILEGNVAGSGVGYGQGRISTLEPPFRLPAKWELQWPLTRPPSTVGPPLSKIVPAAIADGRTTPKSH
ncbi:TMV resistance protein N-like [Hibiscus syriacus]|uniref:TMV resistance protein N-like n=1 Tax=Hibiscus syriacus TaxID=106335 RepID=A0A6A3CRF5_HIBSY|nr:TMV resistance protein N-like [Hibiscus syriacus]